MVNHKVGYCVGDNGKIRKKGHIVGNIEYPNQNGDFRIFPNPFTNNLNFVRNSINKTEPFCISIYEYNGKLLKRFNTVLENQEIDTELFSKGLYFYEIKSLNSEKDGISGKIIKK